MQESTARLARIRLIGFDVDGVFTDGRFYLSADGIETKAFHTQDGYGIRALLKAGIRIAVVSGRKSAAVEKRMLELGVDHVFLGSMDKVQDFRELARTLEVDMKDSAFVGDDLPDLPLLETVGFSFAVANAVSELHERCDYVCRKSGGSGAVREISDLILKARVEAGQ